MVTEQVAVEVPTDVLPLLVVSLTFISPVSELCSDVRIHDFAIDLLCVPLTEDILKFRTPSPSVTSAVYDSPLIAVNENETAFPLVFCTVTEEADHATEADLAIVVRLNSSVANVALLGT